MSRITIIKQIDLLSTVVIKQIITKCFLILQICFSKSKYAIDYVTFMFIKKQIGLLGVDEDKMTVTKRLLILQICFDVITDVFHKKYSNTNLSLMMSHSCL